MGLRGISVLRNNTYCDGIVASTMKYERVKENTTLTRSAPNSTVSTYTAPRSLCRIGSTKGMLRCAHRMRPTIYAPLLR